MSKLSALWGWIVRKPYAGLPWLIWLYVVAVCMPMFQDKLIGFDDNTRMVQVLDWVNGHGWYDRVITRVNAPDGFRTIWSRIVDLPFAAVIIATQNVVGQHTAALLSAYIIPFAELAVLFAAAAYFARPMLGKKYRRLILLFVMFTTVLNFKSFSVAGFHAGEVNHHAWYIILALALYGALGRMVMGVAGSAPIRMASISCIVLLAVGIEAFPIIALGFFIMALIACLYAKPKLAQKIADIAKWAAVGSALAVPLHQPPAQWFSISFAEPSFLGPIIMAIAALYFTLQAMALRRIRVGATGRMAVSAMLGALCLGVLVGVFPDILHGPAAALSPEERALAFREHAEAAPLFYAATNWLDYVGLVMPSLLALFATFMAWKKGGTSRKRALIIAYGGFALGTATAAEAICRFYHHALTTACVWLAWLWQEMRRRMPRNTSYAMKSLLLFIMIGPFWMLLLPELEQDTLWVEGVLLFPARTLYMVDACHTKEFGAYLNAHYKPDTNVLAPGEFSSRLLYHSDLHIDFLSNYPSQNKFIPNQIFFGTQRLDDPRQIAMDHKVDLVAVCPYGLTAVPLHAGEEPMMYERLLYGRQPNWLRRVNTGLPGFMLFEVDKEKLTHERD